MIFIGADELEKVFDWSRLIEALRAAFRGEAHTPTRHHHEISVPDGPAATLLLMPAWNEGDCVGVKLVSIFPGNAARGEPAVNGVYYLASGTTGAPLALLDGARLTLWRTAAASALAADYLARRDSTRLLMVGNGKLAPYLIRAHCTTRPIREVAIWGRSTGRAEALARMLELPGVQVHAVRDLEEAVARADIVSCATLATAPLVRGAWLSPGTHLDLVGGFTPQMREADDEAIRCARVFVDTRAGALHEAGDLIQPLRDGVIDESDIQADLFMLCRGEHAGRHEAGDITFFKSTGTALEDLAAARLAYQRHAAQAVDQGD